MTLFEFAYSLHLTHNMLVEMDGRISQTVFYVTIFSKLRLKGNKFEISGKILAAKVNSAFGVTLDTQGKLWTVGSFAAVNDLE